jgi:hypothetical protein
MVMVIVFSSSCTLFSGVGNEPFQNCAQISDSVVNADISVM